MARILGYIATSLDGFIVDANGSLEWLYSSPVELGEHHYENFLRRIRTIVMGRATYDWLTQEGAGWAYGDQRVYVVTSRPLENPLGPLETRSDVDALIAELRTLDDGDVWMLGGGHLQMAFMQRRALDEIEVYIMPRIIGGGTPLFPATGFTASPRLLTVKQLGQGVRLHYAFDT
jgi:dihydrofolate reductase